MIKRICSVCKKEKPCCLFQGKYASCLECMWLFDKLIQIDNPKETK